MSLMAPLHRQYKTARTETRRHLLLKIRQMPTQTSASRGYVLLRGAIRDTHKSPTNCLPGCGHDPRSAPNLERHGSSRMPAAAWLEIPDFAVRFAAACLSGTFKYLFLIILLITQKMSMLIAAVPSYYFSVFANFVYCGSHTRLTVPIGPFLCLAMMISEIPFISESWL